MVSGYRGVLIRRRANHFAGEPSRSRKLGEGGCPTSPVPRVLVPFMVTRGCGFLGEFSPSLLPLRLSLPSSLTNLHNHRDVDYTFITLLAQSRLFRAGSNSLPKSAEYMPALSWSRPSVLRLIAPSATGASCERELRFAARSQLCGLIQKRLQEHFHSPADQEAAGRLSTSSGKP